MKIPVKSRGSGRNLPDVEVAARIPASGKQQLVSVEGNQFPGLMLNIAGSGKRHWTIQGKIAGKSKRMFLAEFGIDASEVIDRWRVAHDSMRRGIDPSEREAQAEVVTLDGLVVKFLEIRGTKLRPSTVNTYSKTIRLWAKEWGSRDIRSLTPEEVVRKYMWIVSEKSAGSAATWLSAVKSLLNFAVGMELLERNPCDKIKTLRVYVPPKPAERVLRSGDLPRWWKLMEDRISWNDVIFPRMMMVALLTGMRRGEISQLRWSWVESLSTAVQTAVDGGTTASPLAVVDVETPIAERHRAAITEPLRVIVIPAAVAKNGKLRRIPVTRNVGEILDAQRVITEDVNRRAPRQATNDLVFFTGWSNLRPKKLLVSGWGHAVANVDHAVGVRVSLHDLRRTMASVAVGAGMNEVIRKLVLGHAGGDDVTLRSYTVIEDAVVLRELQLVEDRLLEMAEGGREGEGMKYTPVSEEELQRQIANDPRQP